MSVLPYQYLAAAVAGSSAGWVGVQGLGEGLGEAAQSAGWAGLGSSPLHNTHTHTHTHTKCHIIGKTYTHDKQNTHIGCQLVIPHTNNYKQIKTKTFAGVLSVEPNQVFKSIPFKNGLRWAPGEGLGHAT